MTAATQREQRASIFHPDMELRWSHPFGFVVTRPGETDSGPRMLTMVEPDARSKKGNDAEAIAALGRAATRVGCDQILPAEDVRLSSGGRVIIEGRFPEGRPLALLEATLPTADAVGVLRQVLRALSTAHQRGLMHGALSAFSVIIGADRERTTVVTDFGLGRLDHTAVAGPAEAAPCSPEKVLGIESGPAEDVYLFGCVAFQVLAGRAPFTGGEPEELRRRHAIEDAPDLEALVRSRNLPRSVAAVVMRCLAKEPEDRYADAASLEIAWCEAQVADGIGSLWDHLELPPMPAERRPWLRAQLDGLRKPGTPSPLPASHAVAEGTSQRSSVALEPVAEPAATTWRRRAIWAGVVAMVGLFGGGRYAMVSGSGTPGPVEISAVTEAEPEHAEATQSLQRAEAPEVAAPEPTSAPTLAPDETVEGAASDVGVIGDDEDEADEGAEALEGSGGVESRDPGRRAKINELMRRAEHAVKTGQKSRAESLYRDVLALDVDHHGANQRLGALLFSEGEMSGAVKYLKRATATAPRNGALRVQLGDAYFKLGQYAKAKKQFDRAKKYGHPAAGRRLELVDAKVG